MGDPLLSAEDGVPAAEVPAALSDLTTPEPWKILVVDDDDDDDDDDEVHALTRLVLRHVRFRERPLQLIEADSAAAARECLRQHPDAALALVDVVMETPQAGLELVRHIREELGNHAIRLILRTGQPGQAPEQDVVMAYEIDDYRAKTEFSAQRMVTGVIASLRAFAYIAEVERLNGELEHRVAMRTAELERLAMLDPLTGAGNRRHLDDRAAREIDDQQRSAQPIGVVLIDLDHFKQVNDRWGHPAGDQVLQQVVRIAKAELRTSDFLARIGGEEFVILLPGESVRTAADVAERVRRAIENHPIDVSGLSIPVTASFGVTTMGVDNLLESALERADRALYAAKHGGRNRVVVAADP